MVNSNLRNGLFFKISFLLILFGFFSLANAQYLDFGAFQRGADMARQQNQNDIIFQQQMEMRELQLQRSRLNAQQQEARMIAEEDRLFRAQHGPSLPAILISTRQVNAKTVCDYAYFQEKNKFDFSIPGSSTGLCARTGEVWPQHNKFRGIR